MKQLMKFHINGDDYEIAVDINTTLLEVLREDLHLTGAKPAVTRATVVPARCW